MEIFFIIFFLYLILFGISIKIKDNSIVDVFWGTGFLIIASYLFLNSNYYSIENILILLLIFIWGARLTYYIGKRKLKEKKEDPRYADWRIKWKYFYFRSFFQVYILQMILMFIISTPFFLIFGDKNINNNILLFGLIIAIIGLIFEIISDYQVKKFIEKNGKTNKVFTGGLYKYSRNPNYFGESTFWLGLSIIGSNISLYSFIAYITITMLLLFVSGVPLKEKRQEKKENWIEYKRKTNMFFPWFPKN